MMMIPWESIPLWRLHSLDGSYVVKVNHTSVRTHVSEHKNDDNVRLEIHSTDNNRLIGYALKGKRSPQCYEGPFYIGMFYSKAKDLLVGETRKPLTVLYHDYNVRLLAFGDDVKRRDYMLVLRTKPESDDE